MCGIVGVLSKTNSVPVLIDGLKKLEYRGYDSAGLAIQEDSDQSIARARSVGRVVELCATTQTLSARMGIAHTRWATHGVPSERNAHPHMSEGQGISVSVVHNGIIENHEEIRKSLTAEGYVFQSDTDTEVIAHLTHKHLVQGLALLAAVQATVKKLEGAFAIAVICNTAPLTLVASKKGAPLLVGHGNGE